VNEIDGSAAGRTTDGAQLWTQDSVGITDVAEAQDPFSGFPEGVFMPPGPWFHPASGHTLPRRARIAPAVDGIGEGERPEGR